MRDGSRSLSMSRFRSVLTWLTGRSRRWRVGVVALVAAALTLGAAVDAAVAATPQPGDTLPSMVGDPPDGTVGVPYSFTYQLLGEPQPQVAGLTNLNWPPGLGFLSPAPGDIVLTGTPTTAGTFTVEFELVNRAGGPVYKSDVIVIHPAPAPPTLSGDAPDGSGGAAYSYTYTVGGVPAPSVSVTSGQLPQGLTLSSAGELSGTLTKAGTYTFTLTADNGSATTATLDDTVTVSSGPPTLSGSAPAGTVGAGYSFAYTVGGFPDPSVTVTSGQLPPGLTLSGDGTLSGNPTTAGTFTFTLTAENGTGTTTSLPQTVTIAPAPTPPTLSGSAPPGTVGVPYTYKYTLGGVPAPTVSAQDPLPPGLSLSADGVLSGTPHAAGVRTFRLIAANGNAPSATLTNTVQIEPAPAAPTLTGTAPAGTVGAGYSFTYTVGGFPPPSVTVTSGQLPAGLTLTPYGLLSGNPTTAGTSTFTLTATNESGAPATLTQTVIVNPAPEPPTLTGSAPAGTVGTGYSYAYTVGGVPAPTVTVSAGQLPAGLALSSDGKLSGTPTAAGTSTFTLTADNGSGTPVDLPQTLVVQAAAADLAVTVTNPAPFRHHRTGQYVITVTNTGTAATTGPITVVDRLPAGVSYLKASKGCNRSRQTLTFTLRTPLAPGASTTLTVSVTVTAKPGTTLTNTVTVSPTDPTPADNTATNTLTVQT